METTLKQINEQLQYLIDCNTNLKMNCKIDNNFVIYEFTYFDKMLYKQVITKVFDVNKENINPHHIIIHLLSISPYYKKQNNE